MGWKHNSPYTLHPVPRHYFLPKNLHDVIVQVKMTSNLLFQNSSGPKVNIFFRISLSPSLPLSRKSRKSTELKSEVKEEF
jgi:hypothetical protein